MSISRRTRLILAWTGVTLGVLIGALLLALLLMDWNAMKGPIERMASARSGRAVKIAGDIDVRPWSWTPSFAVSGLTLGNPPWEAARPMAQIERLQVQIKLLPLLKGDVILPRVADHQAAGVPASGSLRSGELDVREHRADQREGRTAAEAAGGAGLPDRRRPADRSRRAAEAGGRRHDPGAREGLRKPIRRRSASKARARSTTSLSSRAWPAGR